MRESKKSEGGAFKAPPPGSYRVKGAASIFRHEIFPEFSGIPEFSRPQRSFLWKSQIRFNIYRGQWRSEGGAEGGICPRAPPGGGRQNHAKDFFKIYILRNFEKSERIQGKLI